MECLRPYIIDHGGFSSRLTSRLNAGERIPLMGSIEVTYRCNLRCVHCYLGEYRSGQPGQKELSLSEIRLLLDQVADLGTLEILLTGGEPFVRPDFLDIYAHSKQKGLLVTIFTNGTLITPEIAAALGDLPPMNAEITLYGATQETYELVTGIPGSYARCRRGIDLLLQNGIRLGLKTVLMTHNEHELRAMKDLAVSLGTTFRFDPLLNGGLDGSLNALPLRLSPEKVVEAELNDPIRLEDQKSFFQKNIGVDFDRRFMFQCGAGQTSFHIDPYGLLSPCLSARSHTYNLRQGNFLDAWTNFLVNVRALPAHSETICSDCKLAIVCNMCPGFAFEESGNPFQPVDYLCKVTHLRVKSFVPS